MRVSVLVTLPPQETLRASALRAFTAPEAGLTIGARPDTGGLVLDDTFPALPLSGTTAASVNPAAATPTAAPTFVTRGTIDTERLDEAAAARNGIGIFADPEIGTCLVCGGSPAVGTAATVSTLLDVGGLQEKKLDGNRVAVAILDTGVNLKHLRGLGLKPRLDKSVAWSPPGVPLTPGTYPVDHGTMCAYDALIAAPRATVLDFPILKSIKAGGSIMSGFLSDALLAYSYLLSQLRSSTWADAPSS